MTSRNQLRCRSVHSAIEKRFSSGLMKETPCANNSSGYDANTKPYFIKYTYYDIPLNIQLYSVTSMKLIHPEPKP